jgi:hypothetical protein
MAPVNPASFGKVRNYATSNIHQWSGTAELLPHGLIVTLIGRDALQNRKTVIVWR